MSGGKSKVSLANQTLKNFEKLWKTLENVSKLCSVMYFTGKLSK